jgi:hypothetical protein
MSFLIDSSERECHEMLAQHKKNEAFCVDSVHEELKRTLLVISSRDTFSLYGGSTQNDIILMLSQCK